MRQQFVECDDLGGDATPPLIHLGLAGDREQGGRRGGDALGVMGYLLRLHNDRNTALRDQAEHLIDPME
jgi:hypothetical protein